MVNELENERAQCWKWSRRLDAGGGGGRGGEGNRRTERRGGDNGQSRVKGGRTEGRETRGARQRAKEGSLSFLFLFCLCAWARRAMDASHDPRLSLLFVLSWLLRVQAWGEGRWARGEEGRTQASLLDQICLSNSVHPSTRLVCTSIEQADSRQTPWKGKWTRLCLHRVRHEKKVHRDKKSDKKDQLIPSRA